MPRKSRAKSRTRASTFKVDKVEKELDAVLKKYRRDELGTDIVLSEAGDAPSTEGFYVVMMFRKGDDMVTKSFGRDMPIREISDGLLRAMFNIAEAIDKDDKTARA